MSTHFSSKEVENIFKGEDASSAYIENARINIPNVQNSSSSERTGFVFSSSIASLSSSSPYSASPLSLTTALSFSSPPQSAASFSSLSSSNFTPPFSLQAASPLFQPENSSPSSLKAEHSSFSISTEMSLEVALNSLAQANDSMSPAASSFSTPSFSRTPLTSCSSSAISSVSKVFGKAVSTPKRAHSSSTTSSSESLNTPTRSSASSSFENTPTRTPTKAEFIEISNAHSPAEYHKAELFNKPLDQIERPVRVAISKKRKQEEKVIKKGGTPVPFTLASPSIRRDIIEMRKGNVRIKEKHKEKILVSPNGNEFGLHRVSQGTHSTMYPIKGPGCIPTDSVGKVSDLQQRFFAKKKAGMLSKGTSFKEFLRSEINNSSSATSSSSAKTKKRKLVPRNLTGEFNAIDSSSEVASSLNFASSSNTDLTSLTSSSSVTSLALTSLTLTPPTSTNSPSVLSTSPSLASMPSLSLSFSKSNTSSNPAKS